MFLTVFTPTYNRAYILHRLYRSLCDIVDEDFEWLIVDDGSIDDTSEVIKAFQAENKISIRYLRKQHEGKHAAYNIGLKEARGEFFFNVDSDDCIVLDSINHLKTIAYSIRHDRRLAGYISMKSDRKGHILGSMFDRNLHIASFDELKTFGYHGEYSIIFKTDIAREYPFPVIEGECFMPESVIYSRMYDYKFFVDNNITTICEYLPDGLSSNWNRIRYENPQGFMLYHWEQAEKATGIIGVVKNLVTYNHYRRIAKLKGRTTRSAGRYVILASFLSPISFLLGIKDLRKLIVSYGV